MVPSLFGRLRNGPESTRRRAKADAGPPMTAETSPAVAWLVLVVPCYNEASRLDISSFVAATDAYPGLSFLFVDDGSVDDTRSILHDAVAEHPSLGTVLGLDHNQGKTEAVRRADRHGIADQPSRPPGVSATPSSLPRTCLRDLRCERPPSRRLRHAVRREGLPQLRRHSAAVHRALFRRMDLRRRAHQHEWSVDVRPLRYSRYGNGEDLS